MDQVKVVPNEEVIIPEEVYQEIDESETEDEQSSGPSNIQEYIYNEWFQH